MIAVGAGRFHSAMCTETELYTTGKNLGQLGYKKTYDTQVTPHAVSGSGLLCSHMVSGTSKCNSILMRREKGSE